MGEEKRNKEYCRDCNYSVKVGNRLYCSKRALTQTFVYNHCDYYEDPSMEYIDDGG